MSKPKLWIATTGAGFALLALSVAMGFMVNHHWYVGYETALSLGRTFWWVQAAGIVLWMIGCIGLVVNAKSRTVLLIGLALIVAGMFLLVLFGGTSILNVHSWKIVLIFPMLLVLVNGAMLAIAGFLRLVLWAGK